MFRSTLSRLALAAAAPVMFALIPATPATAAPATPRAVPAGELSDMVVLQTNLRRERLGCGPLAVDPELVLAARRQSAWMAATGTFSHWGRGGSSFVTRAKAAGYAAPSGENIAWGYWSATQAMDSWMLSPGHRANILNCAAKSIGTAVSYSADGTPYYTQLFGWV